MGSHKPSRDWHAFFRRAHHSSLANMKQISAAAAAKYPLCAARNILSRFVELAGRESRVDFSALITSFTQSERARWDRDTREYPRDDYGMLPEAVERFLQTLIDEGISSPTTTTPEATMATATAPKKKTAKKPSTSRKKAATKKAATKPKESAKLSTSTGNAKFDADQKTLDGMEDVKVAPIETSIKKIVAAENAIEAEKSKIKTEMGRLPGLLKKHTLEHYSAHGRDVVRIPGVDMIKLRKVKDK